MGSSANSTSGCGHEGTRDRNALLFAARELLGIVRGAGSQAHLLERLRGGLARVAAAASSSGSMTFSTAVSEGIR